MKNLSSFLLIFFLALSVFASPVSKNEALKVATNHYRHYAPSTITDFSVADVFEYKYQNTVVYFGVRFSAGGFVLVAADDASIPVLGYSYNSYIPSNIDNPFVKDWFDNYGKQIKYVMDNKTSNVETRKEWNAILNNQFPAESGKDVAELLQTRWDQDANTNLYAPTSTYSTCPGGRATAGCVAIAMAQIMKYFNFPAQGIGQYEYTTSTMKAHLSAIFDTTHYQWDLMPNTMSTATIEQKRAVSLLCYHAAVGVEMNFAHSTDCASGAQSTMVPFAMANFFNYSPQAQLVSKASLATINEWYALLRGELDKGIPLYYGGRGDGGGHAFVCDGYRMSGNKFHFNFGWGGSGNGYYYIGAINPIGSSFNDDNEVIINMSPANPNLVVRITEPVYARAYEIPTFSAGETFSVKGKAIRGDVDKLILYVDGIKFDSISSDSIDFSLNTTGFAGGTHVLSLVGVKDSNIAAHNVPFNLAQEAWVTQSSGFTQASRGIDQICIVNADVVWAKAYDGGGTGSVIRQFTKTTNGGQTWTPGNITFSGSTSYGVSNIVALSENEAWACMYPTSGTGGKIVKTTDGGLTWTIQNSAPFTGSWANFVHMWNANDGLAQGDAYQVSGHWEFMLYTTNDGGTTWNQVPIANIPDAQASEAGTVNFYDVCGDTLWFGTNLGRMYRTPNKGQTWEVFTSAIPAQYQTKPVFRNSLIGFALGTSETGFHIAKTIDGGATWTEYTPQGAFLPGDNLVHVPGTAKTWINVSANNQTGSGSSVSFDDCETFYAIDAGVQYTEVAFLNAQTGWAGSFNQTATEGGIYKWIGSLVEPLPFTVTFEVKDNHNNPVSGATVNFDEKVFTTNELGIVVIDSVYNNKNPYGYEVVKEGYFPADGPVVVTNQNITVPVTLTKMPSLTFIVKGEQNEVLAGATVILENDTLITDATGTATFLNVSLDSLNYQVKKTAYVDVLGKTKVTGNDTLTINLQLIRYDVQFLISDEGNIPVENAQIAFNEQTLNTNASGIAVFENVLPADSLTYEVTKEKYETLNGKINVSNNTEVALTLILKKYNVSFEVRDDKNRLLAGAKVTFKEIIENTNATGIATFENILPDTGLTYVVTKDGYETVERKTNISQNTTIKAVLIRLNTVTFVVKDNKNVVLEGAKVKLGSDSLLTNALGVAEFNGLHPATGVAYSVSKQGYKNISGTLDIDTSLTQNISLEKFYKINFVVKNSDEQFVAGVEVRLNTKFATTDAQGKATLEVSGGEKTFTFKKTGSLRDTSVTFNVTKDTTISMKMLYPVGIESLETKTMNIFPNPSQGEFEISLNGVNGTIFVFDMSGKMVYSQEIRFATESTKINLRGKVSKGTYQVILRGKNETRTAKIVVE